MRDSHAPVARPPAGATGHLHPSHFLYRPPVPPACPSTLPHRAAHPSVLSHAPASTDIAWSDPDRHAAFDRWLTAIAPTHGLDATSLRPASSDASFRRYLRIDGTNGRRDRKSVV